MIITWKLINNPLVFTIKHRDLWATIVIWAVQRDGISKKRLDGALWPGLHSQVSPRGLPHPWHGLCLLCNEELQAAPAKNSSGEWLLLYQFDNFNTQIHVNIYLKRNSLKAWLLCYSDAQRLGSVWVMENLRIRCSVWLPVCRVWVWGKGTL